MDDEHLHIHRRNLPHWEKAGSTYFVTFRTLATEFTEVERRIVFDHVRAGDSRFYDLHALVVMPDHVHLIFEPKSGFGLSRIMKGIKGASARLINQSRGANGSVWQDESFDRILRDEAEYIEKWNYIHQNPEKDGMVAKADDYPFLYLAQ